MNANVGDAVRQRSDVLQPYEIVRRKTKISSNRTVPWEKELSLDINGQEVFFGEGEGDVKYLFQRFQKYGQEIHCRTSSTGRGYDCMGMSERLTFKSALSVRRKLTNLIWNTISVYFKTKCFSVKPSAVRYS